MNISKNVTDFSIADPSFRHMAEFPNPEQDIFTLSRPKLSKMIENSSSAGKSSRYLKSTPETISRDKIKIVN